MTSSPIDTATEIRYELRGRWIAGRGLMLWIRDLTGGEPPQSVQGLPPHVFSPVIQQLVDRVPTFRYRLPFTTVSEEHQPRSRNVPCMVISAGAAWEFLSEVAIVEQREGRLSDLGADLHYFAHCVQGVQLWVESGRIVPRLFHEKNLWQARWQLLGGGAQRVWLTELLHVMPPELAHNGGFASIEAFIDTMVAVCARQKLTTLENRPRHPFVEALITGEPYREGSFTTAERLREWQEGAIDTDTELVFRVHEPDETTPDWWGLEVSVRIVGGAPEPLDPTSVDAASFTSAQQLWGRATDAYPELHSMATAGCGEDRLMTTAQVQDFVTRGVDLVRAQGVVVMLPRAWVKAPVTMKLKAQPQDDVKDASSAVSGPKAGLDAIMDYQWQVALGDTVLSPTELFDIVQQQSGLVQLRDGWVQADPGLLRRAAEFIANKTRKKKKAPLKLADLEATQQGDAGDVLRELLGNDAPAPIDSLSGTELVQRIAAEDAVVEVPPLSSVQATLRPYQQRGVDWMATLDQCGVGGILADDMGLGKTLQVLSVVAYDQQRGAVPEDSAVLVVCPMSLVANWCHETKKFVPGLSVAIHHGADRVSEIDEFRQLVANNDIVITTYTLLHRDHELLTSVEWWRLVCDEAQHVKNAATKQSRAVRKIPARHRWALTGTPVENNLEEFRSIMDVVNPGVLGTQHSFRHKYALPIERDQDEAMAKQLRTITAPFVLRRVKSDPRVISDLPEKIEMTVHANLTPEQAGLYQAVVDDMMQRISQAKGMKRKGAVLSALTKLKQVCNHPAHYLGDGSAVLRHGQHRSGKVAIIEELLATILAEEEKALIFTQYKEFGDYLQSYLAQRFDCEVPFLHGSLGREARSEMVQDFQSPDGPSIMVLSLKAGGTGLTLTAANHVIHCDRWWNPAVEDQATDRAYRIGQTKDVQVRKLVCEGTIEERIDEIINQKAAVSELVVSEGESWLTELDDEELATLFRLEGAN
ncbi:MAG TPA: DEAD/DEAH box helicase [Corynebacteriales bacterium]|nr:DEAD/DEAH box helicase [Mycobacteriales bacterium]